MNDRGRVGVAAQVSVSFYRALSRSSTPR